MQSGAIGAVMKTGGPINVQVRPLRQFGHPDSNPAARLLQLLKTSCESMKIASAATKSA